MSCAPQVQTAEEPREWFFTFGSGHTLRGESLGQCFTKIFGTHDDARDEMVKVRGRKWCGQYMTAKAAGVEEYGLIEVPLERLKPEPMPPPVYFAVVELDESDVPFATMGTYDEPSKDADGIIRTPEEQANRIADHLGWNRGGRFAVVEMRRTTKAVFGPDGKEPSP